MKNKHINNSSQSKRYYLTNKNGFTISSILYPAFILIITIAVIIIIVVTQTLFSNNKLTDEISGNLSDNNTMKSLKENVESAIDESSTTGFVYNAKKGRIYKQQFSSAVNTYNWTGKVYTDENGAGLAYIDNSKYCAYKLSSMSGIAVYNSSDCLQKIADQTGCENIATLICPDDSVSFRLSKVSSKPTEASTVTGYEIAVDTTNDITGYKMSNREPSEKTEGLIWVVTDYNQNNYYVSSINVDMPISYVMQYIGGAWVSKTAYIYDNDLSQWNTLYNKTEFLYSFDYTGSAQTFTAPFNGYYTIELWGASGNSYYGFGGYTKGDIYLNAGETLYVYVGQKGVNSTAMTWNGGTGSGNNIGGQGGGATDIRTIKGATDTIWNDVASLKTRIMVAAGGGGDDDGVSTTNDGKGGAAGGLYSYPATNNSILARQTTGTNFGYASAATSDNGGGGAGWYGGYGGTGVGNDGGTGGSSYISGHTGCIAVDNDLNPLYTSYSSTGKYFINTEMIDGKGCKWTSYKTSDCNGMPSTTGTGTVSGNNTQGKAKITLKNIEEKTATEIENIKQSNETTYVFEYSGKAVTLPISKTGKYVIELWGATGGSYYGLGGYTKGEIDLTAGTNLYVYVGQAGSPTTTGTWNGGGGGGNSTGNAGGGATDIRVTQTSSNTVWSDVSSLKSRIMVAAGGGGDDDYASSGNDGKGGAAGGLTGYAGTGTSAVGTQTSGAAFGYGSRRSTSDDGGGGSGWYGGYGGTTNGNYAGSGGSSYISGHEGCIGIKSDGTSNTTTYSVVSDSYSYTNYIFSNTSMIDGAGYNWTTTKNTITQMPNYNATGTMIGNAGNGYAKITLISE